MKTLSTIIGVAMIIMAVLLGYLLYPEMNKVEDPMGSVNIGNEYHYTQFSGAIATSTLIQTGSTVLGSVVITEDSATAVTFWNATSTAAVTDGTYADKIAIMQASLVEGVYTFDVSAYRGLVMISTDGFTFAGDWTVTYR